MKNKFLAALIIYICGSQAYANILLTSRISTSSATATHQTLTQDDGYGYDSYSSTAILGASSSAAQATPYTYGAGGNSHVSLNSPNSLYISGGAYADAPDSGSFSYTDAHSYIELNFTVDTLTHVDLELSEDRVGGNNQQGLLQVFQGNTLLTSISSQTNYFEQITDPTLLSLDLTAGNYKIVGSYSARAYYGDCSGWTCEASSSIHLTSSSTISAVPLPPTALLMFSSLAGLVATKRKRTLNKI